MFRFLRNDANKNSIVNSMGQSGREDYVEGHTCQMRQQLNWTVFLELKIKDNKSSSHEIRPTNGEFNVINISMFFFLPRKITCALQVKQKKDWQSLFNAPQVRIDAINLAWLLQVGTIFLFRI